MLPFAWNIFKSWRYGEVVTVDDPWGLRQLAGVGHSCPPPRHNFTELPTIRSERPPSSCTIRTWSTGCGPRLTSAGHTIRRSKAQV